uniref:Uncharacterized protein n=1 Tax=Leersia perrieri TaxID=77586 RepID=A0A0D9VB20_9ORYZ
MSSSLPIYVEKSLASLHESPSPDTDDGDDVYMAMPKPEFDHWSRSDTAVTPSRFPRVIKTFKKIADIPEPEEPGRTIVRKLNAVLRFRYKRIRWFVIELYQHLKLGTYDEINERHLANKSPRMEFLSDQISIVRDGLPGGNVIVDEHNFRVYPVQALWQEIKRAGGQPIPMPTELERVVTKLIGEPPERIYEPIVPWWVESSNLRTPPIEKKKLEVPIELSHVRLNVTLSKMYKMMSLMLNEISERVLREDWGPPTLTVETNGESHSNPCLDKL